jgi:hypothetical protein
MVIATLAYELAQWIAVKVRFFLCSFLSPANIGSST